MKILALDYDGVIADSQLECLAVGFNAYLRLNKNTKLFNKERFTFGNFNKLIKNTQKSKIFGTNSAGNKKIVNEYKRLRPYVVDAFCYYVMLRIIENNIRIKNQNEYNKIRNKLINCYHKYVNYFYNERYAFQKNYGRYLKFISPYNITNSIKKLSKKYIITIATNNNEKSIKGFLKKNKIPVRAIADSSISTNKVKQIEFIKNSYNAEFSDIYFVDDQVSHFPEIIKLGVNCFLATWGYNNKEQRKMAKRIGVVLLNENNFYKKLK